MEILRAKTKLLFQGRPLSETHTKNSELNIKEIDEGKQFFHHIREDWYLNLPMHAILIA